VKENGREQGLTDKDVVKKFAKEQATARKKANESYKKELKYPRN